MGLESLQSSQTDMENKSHSSSSESVIRWRSTRILSYLTAKLELNHNVQSVNHRPSFPPLSSAMTQAQEAQPTGLQVAAVVSFYMGAALVVR